MVLIRKMRSLQTTRANKWSLVVDTWPVGGAREYNRNNQTKTTDIKITSNYILLSHSKNELNK